MGTQQRNSNMELLRIICMFLIVALHASSQSGIREMSLSVNQFFALLMSQFGRIAVATFVALGAYFLVDIKFTAGRILKLLAMTTFYCLSITLMMLTIFNTGGG